MEELALDHPNDPIVLQTEAATGREGRTIGHHTRERWTGRRLPPVRAHVNTVPRKPTVEAPHWATTHINTMGWGQAIETLPTQVDRLCSGRSWKEGALAKRSSTHNLHPTFIILRNRRTGGDKHLLNVRRGWRGEGTRSTSSHQRWALERPTGRGAREEEGEGEIPDAG